MKNRDILFKAKSFDKNEWIESMTIAYGTIKRKRDWLFMQIGDDVWKRVHPDTVCQFVKDDLFEGDIVERPEHDCQWIKSIGKYQVVWDNENLRYALKTIESVLFNTGAIVSFGGELTKVKNIHD